MAQISTWPGWECVKKLGSGSYGTVYEIRRVEANTEWHSALKVITIPQNESELRGAYSEGMSQNDVTEYFQGIVDDISKEFTMMRSMAGLTNIVSVEDFKIIPHENELGWDILIRMELLTSLQDYGSEQKMTEEQVLRLGVDLCNALKICEDRKIIHRDIKPGNIFVNSNGDFKLGDFGIARTIEQTTTMSAKGTYTYMAPEVYRGEAYGATVDIYSLGLVLYRYLNENRTPFLPLPPNGILASDREKALHRRTNGETVPPPLHGSERLKQAVLKALSYNPADRFHNALEFAKELRKCGDELNITLPPIPIGPEDEDDKPGIDDEITPEDENEEEETEILPPPPPIKLVRKRSKLPLLIAAVAMVFALMLVGAGAFVMNTLSDDSVDQVMSDVEAGAFDDAVSLYTTKIEGHYGKTSQLSSRLSEYLTDCQEDYYNEAIDYEQLCDVIDGVSQFNLEDLEDQLNTLKEYVDEINASRLAYQTAEEYYDAEDYVNALLSYGQVSENDSYYEDAQEKYASCAENYRQEILDSAAAAAENGDYESAILVLNAGLTVLPGDEALTAQAETYSGMLDNYLVVQDVTGMDSSTAQATLTEQGLVVSLTEAYSDTVAEGYVIEQSPAAGTGCEKGTEIVLTISLGVEPEAEPEATESEESEVETSATSAESTSGTWSGWVTSLPSGVTSSEYEIQQKTQYRARDKETTTSTTSSSMSGWTLYNTTSSSFWSDYGSWSSWSTTSATASDSTQVETKTQYRYRDSTTSTTYGSWSSWQDSAITSTSTLQVETQTVTTGTQYYLYHYCTGNSSNHPYFTSYTNSTDDSTFNSKCTLHNIGWVDSSLVKSASSTGTYWSYESGKSTYSYYPNGSKYKCSNTCFLFYIKDTRTTTKTQYRSRTITTTTTWGSWSSYSDTAVSSSSTREVQTRTMYRTRTRSQITSYVYYFYRWGDWSAWSDSKVTGDDVETRVVYNYRKK